MDFVFELINNLIDELDPNKITKNSAIYNFIKNINKPIHDEIVRIKYDYQLNKNNYKLLTSFTKIGTEFENLYGINNCDENNIVSIQISFLSKLIVPIYKKIIKICLEINNELVKDTKKNILYLMETKYNSGYNSGKNNLKLFNINSLYKSIIGIENKILSFDDFGIGIKILNPHYKEYFSKIIGELQIFSDDKNIKEKKFDWYWKPSTDAKLCVAVCVEPNIIGNTNTNTNSDVDFDNFTNGNDEFDNLTNGDVEPIEDFKIIQKSPIDMGSINPSFDIKNYFSQYKNNLKKLNHSNKNISNLIVVEDESFSL